MPKKLLIVIGFLFLLLGIKLSPGIIKFSPVFLQLLFNRDISLKKEDHNINVLLLGIGGGTHEGPNLADTLIFASIDMAKNRVTLISIPRDLWIPEVKERINAAYAVGESKKRRGGLILTKAVVQKILSQPIDYGLVIDFDGFVKTVDLLGGLDIVVERDFDDYQYPDEDKREDLCGHSLEEATAQIATMSATMVFPCRYKHISFKKGFQHMDGNQALIFVRSRYASGPEGTDFARSKRQQKVLLSLRDKIISLGILLNPVKVANLYSILSKSIDTDIEPSEIDDFIRLANKMKNASLYSTVISAVLDKENEDKEKGLLINPPLADYNGAWVLIPKAGEGNYSKIQEYASCTLKKDNCDIP